MSWRRDYASVGTLSDKVMEVPEDHANRYQVIKLTELEALRRCGRCESTNDGSHGITVNGRTRVGYQEQAPFAAEIKTAMRETLQLDERTFALTADVSEANRQVLVDRWDWHLLDCLGQPWFGVYVNTVGIFSVASASYHGPRVAAAGHTSWESPRRGPIGSFVGLVQRLRSITC